MPHPLNIDLAEWTPEAARAIDLCQRWASEVISQTGCEAYLFGSAIYDGGDQFDPQTSDIDLVLLFRDEIDATARASRLDFLLTRKMALELKLVPVLHRTNCQEPGVSVVPISSLELDANIHKSGVRQFFSRNIFMNLATGEMKLGITGAGRSAIADEARQAIEYAQKTRNQYLAVSANQTGGLGHYSGDDPIPKALARAAAQLVPNQEVGEWYDTRHGLELIFGELSARQSESQPLVQLFRQMSKIRGGRGQTRPLAPFDQVLLCELLYDIASKYPIEPVSTWQIRFDGPAPTKAEGDRLVKQLKEIVQDAEILGVFPGSVIVRARSAKHSFNLLVRLNEFDVLSKLFQVDKVQLSLVHDDGDFGAPMPESVFDRLIARIGSWRPLSSDSESMREAKLADWIGEWLKKDGSISSYVLSRDFAIRIDEAPSRVDIVLEIEEKGHPQRIAIEFMVYRGKNSFFRNMERSLRLGMPTILVVAGRVEQLAALGSDIHQLAITQGALRVVTVNLDDG